MNPAQLNPYAPPTAPTGPALGSATLDYYRDGSDLVVRIGSALPEICVRTGVATQGRQRTKKLSWIPPWTIVVFVLIRIVGLICMLVARKSGPLTFSVSEAAESKRKRAIIIGLAVFAGGLALTFAGFALESSAGSVGVVAIILGVVAVFTGIILAAVLHRPYLVRRIAGDYVHLQLKGVALDAFETHRASHQVVAAPVSAQSPFA